MQISTLIGKPVLTRTGDKLGYVTAARLSRDLTKLSALCCADADEEEFYLPARTVLAVGDAVIAGNARLKAPTGVACPVGKRAFSYTGEELGVVTDVETGESPASIKRLVLPSVTSTQLPLEPLPSEQILIAITLLCLQKIIL